LYSDSTKMPLVWSLAVQLRALLHAHACALEEAGVTCTPTHPILARCAAIHVYAGVAPILNTSLSFMMVIQSSFFISVRKYSLRMSMESRVMWE
jgi:hypothetical protein